LCGGLLHGPGAEVARFETEPTGGYAWSLSSDGTRIAVIRNWDNRIHILSLNRQPPVVITAKDESHLLGIYWAADGKGWFSARMLASGAVLLNVDLRGQARPIWELKGDAIGYGMPSPDGQHLAIVATVRTSNVWALDKF